MTVNLLGRLSDEMQNIVQLTQPAPIVADNAQAALDIVFEQLIVDLARVEFRFAKKNTAKASVRRAYRAGRVPTEAIKELANVRTGSYDGVFDFAVHNGRAIQLVQCWSFQLPNQRDLAEEVKAWAWLVNRLRGQGGELITEGPDIEVPSELEVAAVYVPPRPDQENTLAFEEARAAFDDVEAFAIEFEHADEVARHAAARLTGVA